MAFIELLTLEDAGDAVELLEADREQRGYLPNYARAFAHRPEVYRAWRTLIGSIGANMDTRRYELATVAAARGLRSSYCMLAHGNVLAEQFLSADVVTAIAEGRPAEALDDVDRAVMALAEKVATDAASVTQDDIERLRAHGLSDAEIVDVVLAAAARCFFSKTLDGLGLQPDRAFNALPPTLRGALTVGRPIEAA